MLSQTPVKPPKVGLDPRAIVPRSDYLVNEIEVESSEEYDSLHVCYVAEVSRSGQEVRGSLVDLA